MRFEKRFFKMQRLKEVGIRMLSDLLSKDRVINLLPMLIEAWENVLMYDIEDLQKLAKTCKINEDEKYLLTTGKDPMFWEDLKRENIRQFNYQREKFRNLVAEHGRNWQHLVKELIQNKWQELFNNCTNLPTGENGKLNNLTSTIRYNNVQTRYCQTCGRDITNQKEGSKFCGAKYVGDVAAHQCRNNTNNLKYKIQKIQRRGVLFDIVPYIQIRVK